jgi:hypothetical protein
VRQKLGSAQDFTIVELAQRVGSSYAIPFTLKREKCADTPAMPASIEFVICSSALLDEGVSMPSRTGRVILQAFVGKSGSDEAVIAAPADAF